MDRLIIPAFYGACVLTTLLLTVWSRREALVQTAIVLLVGWAACNFVVETRGAVHAPVLIPTIDAILALCVAGVAAFHQNKIASAVFGLFVAVEIVHVAAFQLHTEGSPTYFLALNLLFLLQLTVVGGAGVAALVVRLTPTPRMVSRVRGGGLLARPRAGRS